MEIKDFLTEKKRECKNYEALARLTGIGKSTIYNIINYDTPASVAVRVLTAIAYGLPLNTFLDKNTYPYAVSEDSTAYTGYSIEEQELISCWRKLPDNIKHKQIDFLRELAEGFTNKDSENAPKITRSHGSTSKSELEY